jgi:hypothetical protein
MALSIGRAPATGRKPDLRGIALFWNVFDKQPDFQIAPGDLPEPPAD